MAEKRYYQERKYEDNVLLCSKDRIDKMVRQLKEEGGLSRLASLDDYKLDHEKFKKVFFVDCSKTLEYKKDRYGNYLRKLSHIDPNTGSLVSRIVKQKHTY